MPNRKEILHELDHQVADADWCDNDWKDNVPIWVLRGALALLREQEAVKPVVHITNANLTNGADSVCGKCGGSFLHKAVNFCPWCGREVKWDA